MTDTVQWNEFLQWAQKQFGSSGSFPVEKVLGTQAEKLVIPRDKLDDIVRLVEHHHELAQKAGKGIIQTSSAGLVAGIKQFGTIDGAPVSFNKQETTLALAERFRHTTSLLPENPNGLDGHYTRQAEDWEAFSKELGVDVHEAVALAKDPEKLAELHEKIYGSAIRATSAAPPLKPIPEPVTPPLEPIPEANIPPLEPVPPPASHPTPPAEAESVKPPVSEPVIPSSDPVAQHTADAGTHAAGPGQEAKGASATVGEALETAGKNKWYQFATHNAGKFSGGRTAAFTAGVAVVGTGAYVLTHRSKPEQPWQEKVAPQPTAAAPTR